MDKRNDGELPWPDENEKERSSQFLYEVGDEGAILTPHAAEPVVELLESEVPRIEVSFEAFRDTQLVIESSPMNEVGWLGTIEKKEDGIYRIGQIFFFEQEVSGMHCQFTSSDIGKFYSERLQADLVNGKKILNSILFWGHLHPDDMVDPSDQDEDQMMHFSHNEFFIRGIFTRIGRCKFTFFDYKRGVKIVDCPWRIDFGHNERRAEIMAELGLKVRTASSRRSKSKSEKR